MVAFAGCPAHVSRRSRTVLYSARLCDMVVQPGRELQRADGVQRQSVWGFWCSWVLAALPRPGTGRWDGAQGALSGLAQAPTCRCAVLHLGCRGPLAAWPALWVGVQQLHLHRHRGPFARVLQRCQGACGALTHAHAAAGARRARHHNGSAPPPPSPRCGGTAVVRWSAGGCNALMHWRAGLG